jgi:hypothetical protein
MERVDAMMGSKMRSGSQTWWLAMRMKLFSGAPWFLFPAIRGADSERPFTSILGAMNS